MTGVEAEALRTIGLTEARTRLSELLRQVEDGENFTITRRGVPVAQLVGIEEIPMDRRVIIERLKASRVRRPALPVEELIAARNQGRKP